MTTKQGEGKLVLLTGASGYIAAHVLDVLIACGYRVRCTVRSHDKADHIASRYPNNKSQLEFAIVKDISVEDAFDEAAKGVDAIMHTASPFHFDVKESNEKELLKPAVVGTLSALTAATKCPSVKRVVVTSSFAAILDAKKDGTYEYTNKDWNPITYETGCNGTAREGYVASKKFAEKAAWDFMSEKKPHFDLVTICPPMVFGPILHHLDSLKDLNTSQKTIADVVTGEVKTIEPPRTALYVDVRDLALAHVLSLEKPAASNQRYFITAGVYSWQVLADICNSKYAGKTKCPVGTPGQGFQKTQAYNIDHTVNDLGIHLRSLESTFSDSIDQIISLQQQGK